MYSSCIFRVKFYLRKLRSVTYVGQNSAKLVNLQVGVLTRAMLTLLPLLVRKKRTEEVCIHVVSRVRLKMLIFTKIQCTISIYANSAKLVKLQAGVLTRAMLTLLPLLVRKKQTEEVCNHVVFRVKQKMLIFTTKIQCTISINVN